MFGFAGLYENWLDKETGEEIDTFTIITTQANEVLEPIHERMPVILKSKNYDKWLDVEEHDTEKLEKLLVPYSAKEMESYAVSKDVNVPILDSEMLIEPLNSL